MSKGGTDLNRDGGSRVDCGQSLVNSIHNFNQVGYDGNSPYHHHQARSRDSWSDITDIITKTGYSNGEHKEELISPVKKLTPSSPLYNRDIGPYVPSTASSSPKHVVEDVPPLPARRNVERIELDQVKVDELVAMCSEYERQAQLERNGKLTQNRIMTNGSLTREKRLNSPASPHPSQSSFTFDSNEVKGSSEGDKQLLEIRTPHSYENVVITSGSPRPRIKTIASKDCHGRDYSFESNENRIPLCFDVDHNQTQNLNSPFLNNFHFFPEASHITSAEIYVNKSKSKEDLDLDEKRSSIAEKNANNKYNFLGYDPRKSDDIEDWKIDYGQISSGKTSVLNSSPSWANPKLDIDPYPDYDTVDSPTEPMKASKLTLLLDNQTMSTNCGVDALKMERGKLMKRLVALKSKVSEIELQEDEQLRETEIETALVLGEISVQKEKIKEEELKVTKLKARIRDCDIEMEKCLADQEQSQRHFKSISDKNQIIIETLEKQVTSCDSEDLRKELMESLSQQIELLDVEKKAHEDLEFRLMEEEAGWLSRREDIQKELSETLAKLHMRREKLVELEAPTHKINSHLEMQRIVHLKAIEQDRSRLKEINQELERLTLVLPELDSCDSTTDDEIKIQSGTSVDDLDRICRITSTTPIEVSCNSLGRKTIASLQEIERNRHLHMAKQGSLVIQEERQRVEELKKRVQDEVRAQWEQQKSTQSLSSIASDEPARDSGLGSEEPDKRVTPDEDKVINENRLEGSGSPESRPLSDASSCSEDQVKLRQRNNPNLQRPLTRYLPIRSEALDLRLHIVEAGHQVDLCTSLVLDSVSCRGYLHKLGSRWPKWNKRWFVFDRTKRCLAYFSDKSEKKLRGGAYFQAIEEVYVDHLNSVKSPSPKVTFIVKSTNRTFHLVAPSPEAMRIWVDVIFTGAEGYQQFSNH